MNKLFLPLIAGVCLMSSCEKATPRSYFDRAVLNCNLLHGFAGPAMEMQLQQPSVKLVAGSTTRTEPMTRREMIDDRIRSAEEAYEKMKKLPETDETRTMLQASRAVYDFVLPVYRNEYQQLAKLYDEGAEAAKIEAMHRSIRDNYQAGFQSRMESLTTAAKPYAAAHGINVQWDVRTSPR